MREDATVQCPACGEEINIEEGACVGDIICCPECYIEIEIVKLDPPKVKEFKEEKVEEEDEYGLGEENDDNADEDEEEYSM